MQFKSRKFNYAFILVTLIIASSDMLLIYVNYVSAKQALQSNITVKGEQMHESFSIALKQVEGFMQQTATYIANDERVSQLFWQGSMAVEAEGGGPGGEQSQLIRDQLYQIVANGWEEMTRHYDGRQLHFHLPPDISFLRVHRPARFGDDISAVRHSINYVNMHQQPVSGFELGRVYSGIRGVVPVFHTPDDNFPPAHVGALEAGTSFSHVLNQLKQVLSSEFSIWIAEAHARDVMWPDFLMEYSLEHPIIAGYMLEATTNPEFATRIVDAPEVRSTFEQFGTILTSLDDSKIAVTSFPLYDYLGTVNSDRGAVGSVVVWTSAEDEVAAFRNSVRNSWLAGMAGFVVIEILIYFGIQVGRKTEVRLYQKEVMAVTDGLTGILNRRGFDEAFQEEYNRASRSNSELSVAICDVDFFKNYNDHYGHLNGDDCLKQIASCLTRQLRRTGDLVARYGGEEFVVILPYMAGKDALRFIEALRLSVESLQIPHAESSNSPWVTISCGLASTKGSTPCTSGKELLTLADKALYQAKRSGRNQTVHLTDLPEKS